MYRCLGVPGGRWEVKLDSDQVGQCGTVPWCLDSVGVVETESSPNFNGKNHGLNVSKLTFVMGKKFKGDLMCACLNVKYRYIQQVHNVGPSTHCRLSKRARSCGFGDVHARACEEPRSSQLRCVNMNRHLPWWVMAPKRSLEILPRWYLTSQEASRRQNSASLGALQELVQKSVQPCVNNRTSWD